MLGAVRLGCGVEVLCLELRDLPATYGKGYIVWQCIGTES